MSGRVQERGIAGKGRVAKARARRVYPRGEFLRDKALTLQGHAGMGANMWFLECLQGIRWMGG